MQVHSGRGKVQAGGEQVPCHIPVAVRGWPSGGGSQLAERAPFPQRAPGELCRAAPGFSRPGARSRPAPGVIPGVSRAVPSPEAAWDGDGFGVLRLPPRGEGAALRRRRLGGDRGTGAPAASGRPREGGRQECTSTAPLHDATSSPAAARALFRTCLLASELHWAPHPYLNSSAGNPTFPLQF